MKTFANQHLLSRLPIPHLRVTAERWLESIKPLVDPTDYERGRQALELFMQPGGLGEKLQARLVEHERKLLQRSAFYEPGLDGSWLERFWLEDVYLLNRDPLMLGSNWFCAARDHATVYEETMAGTISNYQMQRAASYITTLLDIADDIKAEQVSPELGRDGFNCMHQYRMVFGMARIPKHGCDTMTRNLGPWSNYIIVMVKQQIYQVEVYGSHGRVSVEAIYNQLEKVAQAATVQKADRTLQHGIGIFTAINRDNWATVYQHLCKISTVNVVNLNVIEHALFVVCLDDYSRPKTFDKLAQYAMHGFNGENRWFDKSINMCIMNDGRAGFNSEHTPCDAYVPGTIMAHCFASEPALDPVGCQRNPDLKEPKLLHWHVDTAVKLALIGAKREVEAIISNSDLQTLQFQDYGSDFIKEFGKCSPDTYIQLAIQVTYACVHPSQHPPAVYETTSSRQFLHGRTETCRSVTSATQNFVQIFCTSLSNHLRLEAFRAATLSHKAVLKAAVLGGGIDRHLFGLRKMMRPEDASDIGNIFWESTAFLKSQHWTLSTAPIFSSSEVATTGFGSVVPDGYGVSYMTEPGLIKVGVESKVSSTATNTREYLKEFTRVLREMALMCVQGETKAKL